MCNKIYHIENHSIKEKKMIKIFKYLSNCKFSYQLPKRNKVLLYDSTINSIRILNLLNITEYYKFNIRDEINIPILIFSILKNGFKNIFTNYKLAHIQFVNPKLVITWTDNDINFYKLKEYLKNICFIAIQNGYRTGDNRDLFFRLEEENYSPKDLRTDLIICFMPMQGI